MLSLKKLTKVKGIDSNDLNNAKQNSYAWSMVEFGDYIYVGTCRNMIENATIMFDADANQEGNDLDNQAEIWRYKKDETTCWERVYRAEAGIYGFREMMVHESMYSTAIYVAGVGHQVCILKSEDGVNWKVLATPELVGSSSRAFVSMNGNLYVSTLTQGIGGNVPYLYVSSDPEYEPFELVIQPRRLTFVVDKNPAGAIDSMIVFNHRLYLGVATSQGVEIWRSKTRIPRMNDWIKVADHGFGDEMNQSVMAMEVFNQYLYISVSKEIPYVYFVPLGAELIRIDHQDRWEVVVGGEPLISTAPTVGERHQSLSGLSSGFNSVFNVYMWQLKSYQGKLIVTTFNSAVTMKTKYQHYLKNKEELMNLLGASSYYRLLTVVANIIQLTSMYQYPEGFEIYTSADGVHFIPEVLDGCHDPHAYGGRTMLVSDEDELYLGTANPYDGCEVYKVSGLYPINYDSKQSFAYYLSILACLNQELAMLYPTLIEVSEELLSKRMQNH